MVEDFSFLLDIIFYSTAQSVRWQTRIPYVLTVVRLTPSIPFVDEIVKIRKRVAHICSSIFMGNGMPDFNILTRNGIFSREKLNRQRIIGASTEPIKMLVIQPDCF